VDYAFVLKLKLLPALLAPRLGHAHTERGRGNAQHVSRLFTFDVYMHLTPQPSRRSAGEEMTGLRWSYPPLSPPVSLRAAAATEGHNLVLSDTDDPVDIHTIGDDFIRETRHLRRVVRMAG
jgi:hypothetical protein